MESNDRGKGSILRKENADEYLKEQISKGETLPVSSTASRRFQSAKDVQQSPPDLEPHRGKSGSDEHA
jgi:hypothetical protein